MAASHCLLVHGELKDPLEVTMRFRNTGSSARNPITQGNTTPSPTTRRLMSGVTLQKMVTAYSMHKAESVRQAMVGMTNSCSPYVRNMREQPCSHTPPWKAMLVSNGRYTTDTSRSANERLAISWYLADRRRRTDTQTTESRAELKSNPRMQSTTFCRALTARESLSSDVALPI